MKSILILSVDAGYGHRSATNSLIKSFHLCYGTDVECFAVNPIQDPSVPKFIRTSHQNYDETVREHANFYQFTYDITNSKPISGLVMQAMSMFLYSSVRKLIVSLRPDAIISTFHLYNGAVEAVLHHLRIHIPHYTVITDLAKVHQLWFRNNSNRLFVGTDQVKGEALHNGYPMERILVSGIPVDPDFQATNESKIDIQKKLGWIPGLPTILAVGGKRVGNLVQQIECIDQSGYPLQLAIVSGGDDALYDALKQKNDWHVPVNIYPFVENMPELLKASDLVVSKAGGLITSECIACGLPMILIDAIPGQETGNAEFLCKQGLAEWAGTQAEMQDSLKRLFADGQQGLLDRANMVRKYSKEHPAETIVKNIWHDISMQTFPELTDIISNEVSNQTVQVK